MNVFTIGCEINLIAHPHGKIVGAGIFGQSLDSIFLQIINPHILGATGFVTLPGAKFT